jgi:hypothetical protein
MPRRVQLAQNVSDLEAAIDHGCVLDGGDDDGDGDACCAPSCCDSGSPEYDSGGAGPRPA